MFFDMQQMAIERVSPLFSIYHERNSVPLFRRSCTFICIGSPTKKVTRGEDMQGMQAQKGMVCLQIQRPSPSINQRIALK